MKKRNLPNIQRKPKQKWHNYSNFCPDCQAKAKKVLSLHNLHWRVLRGKFQIKAQNREAMTIFLKERGVGKHD